MPKVIADVSKKILDAAAEIYLNEGFEKISIRKIAELSGLAVGTVYNRFEHKADILALVISREIEQLKNSMMQKVFGKFPREALLAVINVFIERSMDEAKDIRKYILLTDSQDKEVASILEGAFCTIREYIQEMIRRVYWEFEKETKPEELALLAEIALSLMQVAAKKAQGTVDERSLVVHNMLMCYIENSAE